MLRQTQQTTTTTRRIIHDINTQNEKNLKEFDDNYIQCKIRITRKYKGKRD